MMYFSATAWTIPDILEVNAVFERDYDQAAYELKIGKLAKKARSRRVSKTDQETWKAAIRILEREDHYLLVPLSASTGSTASLLVDRLKLVGTALLICILLFVSIFLIYGKG